MPITSKAATSGTESKTRRSAPLTERKRTPVKSKAATLAAISTPEFDLAAHQEEVAQAAYLNWLQRDGGAGSPEDDWFQAVITVRTKYTA